MDLQLYRKMEGSARETLRLARAHFGDENPVVADALGQLGWALMYLREMDEAEHIARQAVALERKVRGEGSAQEGAALVNLGDVLRHQGYLHSDQSKLQQAEAALRKGLAIRRKQLGNDNDDVGWTLYTLATLLGSEGKTAEAVSVQQEALAIRQKIHGDEHPYTAEDYSQLGALLSDSTNTLDEAVNDLRKGLEILKRTEGEGKYRQTWAERSLADALSEQGKLEEAEIHYRAAATIAKKVMGPDFADLPGFVVKLANILRREGKLTEARARAEKAVAICQRHPDRIEAQPQRAAFAALRDVLTDLGDTAAAQALDIQRRSFDKAAADQKSASAARERNGSSVP
jgi:tetratricopeptide (TPR) repeat protein